MNFFFFMVGNLAYNFIFVGALPHYLLYKKKEGYHIKKGEKTFFYSFIYLHIYFLFLVFISNLA